MHTKLYDLNSAEIFHVTIDGSVVQSMLISFTTEISCMIRIHENRYHQRYRQMHQRIVLLCSMH